MKGIIVINPFKKPIESINQANRMKEEFNSLGVCAEIVDNGWMKNIVDGKLNSAFAGIDFAVFFDKDKYLSNALTKAGIRLFNSHEAIRVCDDKGETYLALSNCGLNIPKTIFAPVCYREENEFDENWYSYIVKEIGFPMIVKESYGSLGSGVYKADNLFKLKEINQKVKLKPHIYQEYLPYKFGTDVRVIVVGGNVVASMERHNDNDFRSNVALGGKGTKITLNKEFKAVAEKCANLLGLDYCGIDLLYGKNGEPYVCEVNSNAFFSGIEKVTGINVARAYAKHIVDSIK